MRKLGKDIPPGEWRITSRDVYQVLGGKVKYCAFCASTMARFVLALFLNMLQNQGVSDVRRVDTWTPPLGVHMRHARFVRKGIRENPENPFRFSKLPKSLKNTPAAKRACAVCSC